MIRIRLFFYGLFCLAVNIISGCSNEISTYEMSPNNLYHHQWVDVANPQDNLDTKPVADLLANYDVVFFGEFHRHPGVHLAQMELFEAMHVLNPDMTLSLEQFERDTQPYVDEYLAGTIGEQYLRDKARAWENYPTSYRPLVEFAKHNGLPVIAANAPKTVVICVGRKGLDVLDAMPASERQYVAQTVDISSGEYRDQYTSFLTNNASHGGGSNKMPSEMMRKISERSFSAQAVRDDTMAESIARHLQKNPERQVLHLNGSFHSKSFLGTVERLKRRMPELKIAVINPVSLGNEKKNWDDKDLKTGNILLLVAELPDSFVQENHKQEWSKQILKKRMDNTCPY